MENGVVDHSRAIDGLHAIPGAPIILGFVLGLLVGMLCYSITGNSLDLFIGGVFFTALLVPPCSAIAGRSPGAWGCVVAIALGIGCSWLMPVHAEMVTVRQWLICIFVLATFAAMLMAVVDLLTQFSLLPLIASGIVTIIGLLWLSWPVWLCSSLTGSQLYWSVMFHPLLAINHVVANNLGVWTEQQVAYSLTNLGQDVQYQLPSSAWPVIGLQAGVAISLIFVAQKVRSARK